LGNPIREGRGARIRPSRCCWGIAVNPQKWEYYHDAGFVYYWRQGNFTAAAQWFQRASMQPGAPNWLRPMTASVLGGGDRTSARFLWQQMLSAEEDWMRRNAERSLRQLDAMDLIDSLEAGVRAAPPPQTGAIRGPI
jgi:hypothetical protein